MIISGVVIDVAPGSGQTTRSTLQGRPGVTKVAGTVSPGRLVAVVEAENNASLDELMNALLTTPGIIGVSPAFIHFDA